MDKDTARRIITHLKAGTTPIDCVEHVNVGNERWYSAAAEQFDEIAADGDAVVRFIKGYYGDGKTHCMGMLRALALAKGWAVTYVTAENTPLNKYDAVYAQLVTNLVMPPSVAVLPWVLGESTKGAYLLLAALFSRWYFEAYRLPNPAGLQKERVLQSLREKVRQFAADPRINERLGRAVGVFVEAVLRGNGTDAHDAAGWLEGAGPHAGGVAIGRRIDQRTARDAARGVSIIAKAAGAQGVLVLLDEAERIMEQSRSVRNKSYGVLRDLLDNADNQGGMHSSVVYVAATPEMFETEKGFAEYDALRSRLANSTRFAMQGIVDWRGVVVDLTKTPLPLDHLMHLAERVIGIHAVAREWSANESFEQGAVAKLVTAVQSGVFAVSKPRLLASSVAIILEVLEQNRQVTASELVDSGLQEAHAGLTKRSEPLEWA